MVFDNQDRRHALCQHLDVEPALASLKAKLHQIWERVIQPRALREQSFQKMATGFGVPAAVVPAKRKHEPGS